MIRNNRIFHIVRFFLEIVLCLNIQNGKGLLCQIFLFWTVDSGHSCRSLNAMNCHFQNQKCCSWNFLRLINVLPKWIKFNQKLLLMNSVESCRNINSTKCEMWASNVKKILNILIRILSKYAFWDRFKFQTF